MRILDEDKLYKFLDHCNKTAIKACKNCTTPLPNEYLEELLSGALFECSCGCSTFEANPYQILTYTRMTSCFMKKKDDKPQIQIVMPTF